MPPPVEFALLMLFAPPEKRHSISSAEIGIFDYLKIEASSIFLGTKSSYSRAL
jgi:hypothetical protein